jgi:hypothetical protein
MINVEWQNERGECTERYAGPPIGCRRFSELAPYSACLRFIDPIGDTTFNAAQVEVLEAELRELARTAKNHDVVQQANSLLDFLGRAGNRLHMYVKFIGD